jgi:hypothetical protein
MLDVQTRIRDDGGERVRPRPGGARAGGLAQQRRGVLDERQRVDAAPGRAVLQHMGLSLITLALLPAWHVETLQALEPQAPEAVTT